MMKVTLTVHPGGRDEGIREIGDLYVWNLSSLAEVSDYAYSFEDPRSEEFVGADGFVIGHRRSDGPWPLVLRALDPDDEPR